MWVKFGERGKAFRAEGTACTRPRGSGSGGHRGPPKPVAGAQTTKGREEPDVLSGGPRGGSSQRAEAGPGLWPASSVERDGGNGIGGVEAGSYIPGLSPAQVAARGLGPAQLSPGGAQFLSSRAPGAGSSSTRAGDQGCRGGGPAFG